MVPFVNPTRVWFDSLENQIILPAPINFVQAVLQIIINTYQFIHLIFDIFFVNSMQKHVRREQILSRNNVTGRTKVDNAAIKQWIALSKHKLDLIKYYKGPLSKEIASKTQNINPYSFS